MEIQLRDHTDGKLTRDQSELSKRVLEQAAQKLAVPSNAEMSLTFVLNPEIRELNRDYRGVDRATDVISFAIEDDDDLAGLPEEVRAELPVELGDLIISVDKIEEQALFLNHSEERELGYLLVHGFLHLNGYDHEESDDEQEMFTLQEEILDELGLSR
ncbi:MAG: rRNA maturation RNase YbeY [Limosilactobacillus gorillae]|uniref:rRNA maturation RNase YbeY n=1 Tax=Limosilactobacillus gorillae TaxID=1450649 RepID=UPI000B1E0641|nr:rRNA maturation RNase YbeY [Limosilactobacillus gorillae]MDO4855529.1 rRNA maturation RNase YbeY [Limosilactobacillus gorillae]